MDIISEITGFFQRLFRQQVNRAESQLNQKVRSAQVKARSKAANAVNQKIKAGTEAAKRKASTKLSKDADKP